MISVRGSGCRLLGAVALGLFLTSCGGGGGGGSTPGLDDQAYTGVRTEASINLNNAEPLVFGAFAGESVGTITPLVAAAKGGTVAGPSPLLAVELANLVIGQLTKRLAAQPAAYLDPATECVNYPAGTLTDTLVESLDGSGTVGTLRGTVTYNNCDVGGVILDGPMAVLATLYLLSGDMSLELTLDHLHGDDGVAPATLVGYISGTDGTDPQTLQPITHLAISLTMIDDATGKGGWLKNYGIDETQEATGYRSLMSGRYFHHDYGYVDFSTDPADTIFIPFDTTASTYDGRLDFTGAELSRATLWLGTNATAYCINVFGITGNYLGDLGTCALP